MNNEKLKGATYQAHSRRWVARIRIKGKLYHLGSFPSAMEAHKAYTYCANSKDPLAFIEKLRSSPIWGKTKYSSASIEVDR